MVLLPERGIRTFITSVLHCVFPVIALLSGIEALPMLDAFGFLVPCFASGFSVVCCANLRFGMRGAESGTPSAAPVIDTSDAPCKDVSILLFMSANSSAKVFR
eukprot:600975-Prorocentrum_minimum.AAC.1